MARKYWLQLQLWLCFDSSLTWCIPSKKGQYDVAIFLISLLIVSKVVIRQCSTHSRWMWMKPAVVIADSLEWDQYDSLWIWWSTLSRHCQMQPVVVIADSFEWHRYDSLWIWRSTLSRHCHSPFFLTFSVFERMYQHSVKIMVCCWLVPCDSGPDDCNFIDSSSDSDCRQNGRLWPTATPASTPTPQPWFWVPISFLYIFWKLAISGKL